MKKKKNYNYNILIILIIIGILVFLYLFIQLNQLKKNNPFNELKKFKFIKTYNCKVYKIEPNISNFKELSLRLEIDEKNNKINIPNGEAYDVKFERDQILWKNRAINTITKENLVSHNQFFINTNDWRMTTYLNKENL